MSNIIISSQNDEIMDRLLDSGDDSERNWTFNSTWRKSTSKTYGMYMARYTPVHSSTQASPSTWLPERRIGRYMAIGSKAGRRVKHAGNDGQAKLQRERTDRHGRNLSAEVREYYCFISKWNRNFKQLSTWWTKISMLLY